MVTKKILLEPNKYYHLYIFFWIDTFVSTAASGYIRTKKEAMKAMEQAKAKLIEKLMAITHLEGFKNLQGVLAKSWHGVERYWTNDN